MMDAIAIEAVEAAVAAGYPAGAGAVLIVELDGPPEQVEDDLAAVERICARARRVRAARSAASAEERAPIWRGRKAAFAAMGRISPDYYVQDGVVPRTRLPAVLRRIEELAAAGGLRVGNVFHAGDGNLHPLVLYDGRVAGEAERAQQLAERILEACIDAGGSMTGEHGIGTDKACAMPLLFSEADLEAMARLRRAFDPAGSPTRARSFRRRGCAARCPGPTGSTRSSAPGSRARVSGAGVIEYEPGDLTVIVAGARCALAELAAHARPSTGSGCRSIRRERRRSSECLLEDLSGPLRHRFGTMRDLVLGVTVVLGDGTRASSGGKVVKNVAGYDLGKLFCGSRGRLGLGRAASRCGCTRCRRRRGRSRSTARAGRRFTARSSCRARSTSSAASCTSCSRARSARSRRSCARSAARRATAGRRSASCRRRCPAAGAGCGAARRRRWCARARGRLHRGRARGALEPARRARRGGDVDPELIADCVHCGFCLPTCPTYELWHEEMDSPRGRIHLMGALADGSIELTDQVAEHFDRCLGCMACVTACPSGVQYDRLIEQTRARSRSARAGRRRERLLRARAVRRAAPPPPPARRAGAAPAAGARSARRAQARRAAVVRDRRGRPSAPPGERRARRAGRGLRAERRLRRRQRARPRACSPRRATTSTCRARRAAAARCTPTPGRVAEGVARARDARRRRSPATTTSSPTPPAAART